MSESNLLAMKSVHGKLRIQNVDVVFTDKTNRRENNLSHATLPFTTI